LQFHLSTIKSDIQKILFKVFSSAFLIRNKPNLSFRSTTKAEDYRERKVQPFPLNICEEKNLLLHLKKEILITSYIT